MLMLLLIGCTKQEQVESKKNIIHCLTGKYDSCDLDPRNVCPMDKATNSFHVDNWSCDQFNETKNGTRICMSNSSFTFIC